MQRSNTRSEDQLKIKTLCEYLFFDQFQDTATFPRFEQCFQPLFNYLLTHLLGILRMMIYDKY